MNLGFDPVNRIRHQAHALLGIEALDGLHQADIAFLDQVGMRKPIAQVAARDRHHQTQVRHDQGLRCGEVILIAQLAREASLFLLREHRKTIHCGDVGINIAEAGRETERQRLRPGRHEG